MKVAFDIGNVLCTFDFKIFTEQLRQYIKNNYSAYITEELNKTVDMFLPNLQKYQDLGITTVRQALQEKFIFLNKNDIDKLISIWNSGIVPSNKMIKFLDILRFSGIRIALLSNMGQEHISYLRYNFPDLFKDTIQHISCEVGARKPSKLFYSSFCQENSSFTGCLYIDDIDENLIMSKKYGFSPYKFELDNFLCLTLSQQKNELDKIENMIKSSNF